MAIVLSEQELGRILSNPDTLMEQSLEGCSVDIRTIADMCDFFLEPISGSADQIVYEVFSWPESGEATDLLITITVLHPGKVGNEQFHTKGHFHRDVGGPEFIVGYQGTGILQLGDETGHVTEIPVIKGTHVWVPSGSAHRMVNRSPELVTYLSISSAYVGHDYDSVVKLRWKQNISKEVNA